MDLKSFQESSVPSRRQFVKSSLLATAGFAAIPSVLLPSCKAPTINQGELASHTIDRVEVLNPKFHWPRFVGKNGRIDDHGQHHSSWVVRLTTDQGATGWGMTDHDAHEKAQAFKGKRVSDLITPGTGLSPTTPRYLDFALHDLMGVILDKPVYELLGGRENTAIPVYSGMIYLDELNPDNPSKSIDRVLENCLWDYEYGYRQLKIKIGRSGRWYEHDAGLARDIEVVKAIHEEFAPKGVRLLVDSNDMYSLEDTYAFLKGIGDVPLLWVEEPFAENKEEGKKLREWMNAEGFRDTLYADGEHNPKHEQCMALAEEGILDVYLNDIYGYGFTNWVRLMPALKKMGTLASPHAWGDRLKTHYTLHLAAALGNVVTAEGVTCLSDDIDYGDYIFDDGKVRPSQAPGFGIRLLI